MFDRYWFRAKTLHRNGLFVVNLYAKKTKKKHFLKRLTTSNAGFALLSIIHKLHVHHHMRAELKQNTEY